jgi:hypothetical protein
MVNPAGSNKKSRKGKDETISGGIIGSPELLSRVGWNDLGVFNPTSAQFVIIPTELPKGERYDIPKR